MEKLDQDRVVYNINDFPYHTIYEYKRVRKSSQGLTYINVPAAFDIETTSWYCQKRMTCKTMRSGKCPGADCKHWIEPFAWMYHWQFCLGDNVCFGRTWDEYRVFCDRLKQYGGLSESVRLPVYVHNLAYEFQFLQREFDFKDIFARQSRKPLRALCPDFGMEYRCSYTLTNLSLQKWTEQYKVKNQKQPESYDYNLIRYWDTPLMSEEKIYCYIDVKGLCECLEKMLKDDNVVSIPMTSTGYVRRECRKAVQANKSNIRDMRKWRLSPKLYQMCKEELRGGDTHANHYYTGLILEDMQSYDITSSYPYVAMSEKFPTKFVKECENQFKIYEYNENYGFIGRFCFTNLRYKGSCNIPYISLSKLSASEKTINDNGRVLKAKVAAMTINEIDYRIIKNEYTWDEMYLTDFYVSKLKPICVELRQKILEYFKRKTNLKGIDDYMYMKSKNRLNGIYGMMITDITSDIIRYEDGAWTSEPRDIEEALDDYYDSYNSFLNYQQGIWVVAYARRNLRRLLNIIGKDVVYCDTDSVKCLGDWSAEVAALNKEIMERVLSLDIVPVAHTPKGEACYMGVWEREKDIALFRTWGAKKYATKFKAGSWKITVAGLNKEIGSKQLAKHGMSCFEEYSTFFPSGRLEAFYNDVGETREINGRQITSNSFVAMMPGAYTLGITDEYRCIISNKKDFWLTLDKEACYNKKCKTIV